MPHRNLFITPPDQLQWEDVEAFLSQGIAEGERVDYKRELNDRVPQTITAMANTTGGLILVGVDEDSTTKKPQIPPVGISSNHVQGGTLTNLCYSQLEPSYLPLNHFVHPRDEPQRGVLVIQVRPELAPVPI